MSLDFNSLGVSFDDVEEASKGGFTLIPAGKYKVQVESVEDSPSKSGLAGRKFVFKIIEGDFTNQKIFKNFYLESANGVENTKKMLGMFSGFLNSCGVTKEERQLLFNDGFNAKGLEISLSERTYEILVEHREYNGNTYADFKKVLSYKDAGASF